MKRRALLSRFAAGLLLASGLGVGGSTAAPTDVSFTRDIAPILTKKCVTCHRPEKAKGNYQLHNFESLMKPGASQQAPVKPGQPAMSELFRLLVAADADDRMPQKDDPLPKGQIALIESWIQQGAKFDGPNATAHLTSLIPREPHPNPPTSYARPVPVAALAFSPDGAQLAASGYHEVTLWDASNGKLLRRVKNLPQRIQALAWHPAGQWLAVGGGTPGQSGEITLVDATKGEVGKVLGRTIDTVMTLAFDAQGERLAAGGADNAIRVFSMPDGKELRLIQQHADWVLGLAFSPDGQHLASASRDRSARVFGLATGELEASYMGHEAPVSGVTFSRTANRSIPAGATRKCTSGPQRTGRSPARSAARKASCSASCWRTGRCSVAARTRKCASTSSTTGRSSVRSPATVTVFMRWPRTRRASGWPAARTTARCACGTGKMENPLPTSSPRRDDVAAELLRKLQTLSTPRNARAAKYDCAPLHPMKTRPKLRPPHNAPP